MTSPCSGRMSAPTRCAVSRRTKASPRRCHPRRSLRLLRPLPPSRLRHPGPDPGSRSMITTAAPEFAANFPNGGRLAGLDVGTKTIGVAFCDTNWSFATPDKTIVRKKFSVDLETPQSPDRAAQHRRPRRRPAAQHGRHRQPAHAEHSAPSRATSRRSRLLLLWDERWSTAAVERAMIAADVSRAKRATRVDSAAAAFILQGAIDADDTRLSEYILYLADRRERDRLRPDDRRQAPRRKRHAPHSGRHLARSGRFSAAPSAPVARLAPRPAQDAQTALCATWMMVWLWLPTSSCSAFGRSD